MDPHRSVQGKGLLHLHTHQIQVDSFDLESIEELNLLNKEFIGAYLERTPDPEFIRENAGRPLDASYRNINGIYWRQNLGRTPEEVFAHLVEAASATGNQPHRQRTASTPVSFVIKSLAWWLALCGKMKIRSVEDMVWAKYPGVCPYCLQSPHVSDCKNDGATPDWCRLAEIGSTRTRPTSLNGWQSMFREIYPETSHSSEDYLYNRLHGEIGELAEAVRTFDYAPGLFLNEAPDVFAWLLQRSESLKLGDQLLSLQSEFCSAYPDFCLSCASEICECPSTLLATVGRLGGSIPPTRRDGHSVFMPADEAAETFGA